MHFLIDKNAFVKALKGPSSIAPKKSTKPILKTLLVRASKSLGEVEVIGSDEEISVRSRVEANVLEDGEVCVDAKDLVSIAKSLPSGDVELREGGEVDGKSDASLIPSTQSHAISIFAQQSRFTLCTLPASEYPSIEFEALGEAPAMLSPHSLSSAIQKTLPFVSHEETRYYLGGIYAEPARISVKVGDSSEERDAVAFVSTDGHRLALCKWEAPAGLLRGSKGAILPARMMKLLLDEVAGATEKEMVRGLILDKRAFWRFGNTTIQGLLVEGSFPDYRQVLPKNPPYWCAIETDLLDGALKRVVTLSPDQSGGMRFLFDASNGENGALTLESSHTGRGKAREVVPVREMQPSEPMEIGFNAHYWRDAVGVSGHPRLMISYTNHLSPAMIQPCDADGVVVEGNFYVLMPMRL